MVMTVLQFDRCTSNTTSEIPSFRMYNIRYAWIIQASFGTINTIIINYFCHILFLLGSLLIIRRKKIEHVLLSFVLHQLCFISNNLKSVIGIVAKCKMGFRGKKTKSIHLKVICHCCIGLSASQNKENCCIFLYLENTNEKHYSNTAS